MNMRAIVFGTYGSAEVLRLEELPRPVPAADEVLVRVRAASLNAADTHLMHGRPFLARLLLGLRRPKCGGLGLEFAGEIEAVGAAVQGFGRGDRVFGELAQNHRGDSRAFAEYVRVPQSRLVRIPETVSFVDAAATPMAGCAALYAIRDYAKVQPGEHVLVNGAGGGVGTFAVMLAKLYGAKVTAVCSAGKAETVRAAGADHVIDYRQRDFTAGDTRYDVIVDLVSSLPFKDCRRALVPRGRFVWVGSASADGLLGPIGPLLKVMAMSMFDREHRWLAVARSSTVEDIETLAGMIGDGRLRPFVGGRFALADAADAVRSIEAGRACGKLVVEP